VVERVPRGGDGGVDVLWAGNLDMADRFFGVRRDHRKLLGVGRFAPLAPDEKFVVGPVAIVFRHGGTYLGAGRERGRTCYSR
jgi:hypothetical protein